ncbi:MAG: type II secretion system protein [Vulcanimicrobiaceae bacterium]
MRPRSRQDGNARERGFTLVEMMIVIAIIAILVSILVPNFIRARAQAQTAACMMNLKEIATALELYETDHLAYPPSGAVDGNVSNPLLPYLKQVPIDSAAGPGASYSFAVTGGSTSVASYTITCPGLHDPATLQNISPGTVNQHIAYSSNGGYSAVASQP